MGDDNARNLTAVKVATDLLEHANARIVELRELRSSLSELTKSGEAVVERGEQIDADLTAAHQVAP